MPKLRLISWILILLSTPAWLWGFGGRAQGSTDAERSPVTSYKVIEDNMGTKVIIGLRADVNEEELRATLRKAADDHQNDPARDYLGSMYLWVEAYLVLDGRQSATSAGILRRCVPFDNPRVRQKQKRRYYDDKFTLTLAEAKHSLGDAEVPHR